MRTEISNSERDYPPPAWMRKVRQVARSLALALFKTRLRRMRVGSPLWHKLQERLAHRSSVGLDSLLRNTFYMTTLSRCGSNLFVHPGVMFYYPSNVTLGNDVFLNRGVFLMAPVEISIGNNVLIGPYSVLNSGSHRYESRTKLIDEQGHKYGPIVIGDDVWIGAHACILPGVHLGDGAVVAAGAVVTKSVDAYTVVAGVPARVIGHRNAE
jgi:acetyltransferase-like isoleucine patch superfamily enzyme